MARATTRRGALAGLGAAAFALAGGPARASEAPIQLSWDDLVPGEDGGLLADVLKGIGVVRHGELEASDVDGAASVTTAYNGKRVRIPGFVVPLEFAAAGVTSFMLVPYVGACIHVPPPPPNQLIHVTADPPHEGAGLFEPVWVTGTLEASATETDIADAGYAMSSDRIEPYEE